MGIPAGTVLARSKREGWTQRIATAKLIERPERAMGTAGESAALTMQARAERHVVRMAGITDKALPHLESMEPAEFLDSARNLERFDYFAGAITEWNQPPGGGLINLAILTNQAVIVESKSL